MVELFIHNLLWMNNSDPLFTFSEPCIVIYKSEKYKYDAHIFLNNFIPITLSSTCFEQIFFIIRMLVPYTQHTVFYPTEIILKLCELST